MSEISFSRDAVIDFNNIKKNHKDNDMIYVIIDKESNEALRIVDNLEEVSSLVKDLVGHYKSWRIHFDGVKVFDINKEIGF